MKYTICIFVAILFIALSGCSNGGQSPVNIPADENNPQVSQTNGSNHMNWGLWQIIVDPAAQTLDAVRLREGAMHLNALVFLEPPVFANLTLESLQFNGNIIEADIGLRHPFIGLDEFTGFDVCGIFISSGSVSGFSDPSLVMAGPGNTRLLNPDGYSRWWNPAEFPADGTMLGYKDGLLGAPDSIANFSATLNGYKFFTDDLTLPNQPVSDAGINSRCAFSAGMKNIRHYTIELGTDGLVFNYAVDASWRLPDGTPPYQVPEDFPAEANRPEAWNLSVVETSNTLFNDGSTSGGDLSLEVDLWDHFNADLNILRVESPGNFGPVGPLAPTGGGNGYSAYTVDIVNATPAQGAINILIIAQSEVSGYQGLLPGKPVSAYFLYTADVGSNPNIAPTALMEATTSTSINAGDTVSFDASASTGTAPLTFTWDFNSDSTFSGPEDDYTGNVITPTHQFNDSGTFPVKVKVTNDYGFDISDPVNVQVGYNPNDIFVDADYTGGSNDGTQAHPFLTIQEGMAAVTAGLTVHVDYKDGGDFIYNTNGLTLKSDVTLKGDNWNGGGPGKPIVKATSGTTTISSSYSALTNFTIEGFEIRMAEDAAQQNNMGIYIYGSPASNIIIRHCKFTGTIDDTGKTGGIGIPIYLSNCDNSTIESNDIGPLTWNSDTGGVYARVLWSGMYLDSCDNVEVKNNSVHDTTVNYNGDGNWGQIRVFGIHCYACNTADVHNNLICHVKGINDYDYRIEGMMIEGYGSGSNFHYYNNTIDNLDHSQSNGGFPLRGIFIYADNAPGTYLNNTLITNFYTPGSAGIQAYFSSPINVYDVTYSTGYNLGTLTDYFYNLIEGAGITDYPGINPMYVNPTSSPYDYTFQSGSLCEYGDPNFLDWDDTGTASGNPGETDINNRSRMGCFGGPDGNWDPNNL